MSYLLDACAGIRCSALQAGSCSRCCAKLSYYYLLTAQSVLHDMHVHEHVLDGVHVDLSSGPHKDQVCM